MGRRTGQDNGRGTGRFMDVTSVRAAGTSGEGSGTNGISSRLRPFLLAFLLILVGNSVNVLTILQDAARDGRPVDPVWPIMTEGTSGIAMMMVIFVPAIALARAPIQAPWGRQVLTHGVALLIYSCLHVVGMSITRQIAAGLIGLDYTFPVTVDVLTYEFRKDAVSYFITVMIFLALGHGRGAPAVPAPLPVPLPVPPVPADAAGMGLPPAPPPVTAAPPAPPLATAPARFDIRDGATLHRVPVADIIAVRAAANYVEFLLADGRRPLMRATLTQLAGDLASHGFLRTHRSWLVNALHVTAVVPEGSGDHELTLSDGTTAPLSRRFPDALVSLRG
jgi:hypothetical protein